MSTPNLGLNLPAHGSQNWDTPTNDNWGTVDGVVGGGVAGQILMSQGPNQPPLKRTLVNNEIPGGAINGTTGSDGNADFTLAKTPYANLKLTKNGVEMYEGTAFTIAANIITYLAPYIPVAGDDHRASYIY
jgi:hypothetical protein